MKLKRKKRKRLPHVKRKDRNKNRVPPIGCPKVIRAWLKRLCRRIHYDTLSCDTNSDCLRETNRIDLLPYMIQPQAQHAIKKGPKFWIVLAIIGLIIIALVDYFTGYELQFFVFYYLPISIGAYKYNKKVGYALAVASSFCWFFVDICSHHPYNLEVYRIWNTLIRTTSFVLIVELLARLRTSMQRQQKLYADLTAAHAEVKVLQGILPICCVCKRIRDEQGKWEQIESFIHRNSEADFSHGMCPECVKKTYPDLVAFHRKPKTAVM